jgi:hypothetical protein
MTSWAESISSLRRGRLGSVRLAVLERKTQQFITVEFMSVLSPPLPPHSELAKPPL